MTRFLIPAGLCVLFVLLLLFNRYRGPESSRSKANMAFDTEQRIARLENEVRGRDQENLELRNVIASLQARLETERAQRAETLPRETESAERGAQIAQRPSTAEPSKGVGLEPQALAPEQARGLEEHLVDRVADRNLELRGAELDAADLIEIAGLADLESLNLRGSNLTDEKLSYLRGMTQLSHLDLRATDITGDGLHHVPAYLESLHLTDTKVGGPAIDTLPNMPNLKTLKLNRLVFGDEDVASLGRFSQLEHLEVDGTAVTDVGLENMLSRLPNLRRIELRRTRWSQEGIARLRELYPDCELVFD